jgi:hypothetical protein
MDKLATTDFPPISGQDFASAKPAAQSVRKNPGLLAKKATFTGGSTVPMTDRLSFLKSKLMP